MTDMENRIEQAARAIYPYLPMLSGSDRDSQAVVIARALADADLLAPTPLREEWAICHPSGNTDMRRDKAHAQRGVGNGWFVAHRYVTDWLPVENNGSFAIDDEPLRKVKGTRVVEDE